jgi:hypothetical protein
MTGIDVGLAYFGVFAFLALVTALGGLLPFAVSKAVGSPFREATQAFSAIAWVVAGGMFTFGAYFWLATR